VTDINPRQVLDLWDRDPFRVTKATLAAALRAALATQPEPGIPIYAMLDVWMALGGDPAAFDRMWAEPHRTPADTWAQLMAAAGQRLGSLAADTNPPIGPEFDRLIFPAAEREPQ